MNKDTKKVKLELVEIKVDKGAKTFIYKEVDKEKLR